jgi:hypothetical protein
MGLRITRRATARWNGQVSTGTGELSVASGAFTGPEKGRVCMLAAMSIAPDGGDGP